MTFDACPTITLILASRIATRLGLHSRLVGGSGVARVGYTQCGQSWFYTPSPLLPPFSVIKTQENTPTYFLFPIQWLPSSPSILDFLWFLEVFVKFDPKFTKEHKKKTKFEVKVLENYSKIMALYKITF